MPDFSGEPWAERMLGRIDASSQPRSEPRRKINVMVRPQAMGHVIEAARRRKLSLGAYAFRALWAFVCADLGLDWFEEMEYEPRPRRLGQRGFVPGENAKDVVGKRVKGRGHGSWKIEKLGTYGD